MSKSPAFQFYPDKFITGTSHFTPLEVGIYIRLLCFQWESGFIPDDPKMLARIAGCKTGNLTEVLKKFTKGGNGLINERLEISRAEQIRFRELKSEAGKKGNEKRWAKHRTATEKESHSDSTATAEPIANGRSSSSSSSSISNICVRAREMTCRIFGVSEIKNFKAFREITDALMLIDSNERIGYYIQQLEQYTLFKRNTGQQKCNWQTWVFGEITEERHIDNGHWCRTDYQTLNKENNGSVKRHLGGAATAAIESGKVKDFSDAKF